jgi:hypothetical protein
MALTTYMTSWQDFDKITLVQLPLFLFSATFFPSPRTRRRCAGWSSARRSTAAWCCAAS